MLINPTINNVLMYLSESTFSLNIDIFETNVINLLFLNGAIFYFLGGALSESLINRKKTILQSLQKVKEQINSSKALFFDNFARYEQIPLIIEQVNYDGSVLGKKIKNIILTNGRIEVVRLEKTVQAQVGRIEARIYKEISKASVKKALKQVVDRLNVDVQLLTCRERGEFKEKANILQTKELLQQDLVSKILNKLYFL